MKYMPADLRNRMPEYGGLEDASGRNYRWPVSAVDWDMEIVEQSADRAVIAFSALIPGTPFLLRRAATLNANSAEIQFDYNIRNTAPKGLQSDDPESFQLPWRLRLLPGIGKDGAGPSWCVRHARLWFHSWPVYAQETAWSKAVYCTSGSLE